MLHGTSVGAQLCLLFVCVSEGHAAHFSAVVNSLVHVAILNPYRGFHMQPSTRCCTWPLSLLTGGFKCSVLFRGLQLAGARCDAHVLPAAIPQCSQGVPHAAYFYVAFNSLVHVVMYTYYLLASAIGKEHVATRKRYLWWGQYLTMFQMFQFVCMLFQVRSAQHDVCSFVQYLTTFQMFQFVCMLFQARSAPLAVCSFVPCCRR